MSKFKLLASAIAATAFSLVVAQAATPENMEKCVVVDSNGKNLIKEHKNDCAAKANSCAGTSTDGTTDAWIYVPKGECAKINSGDFSGVSEEVKAKINMEDDSVVLDDQMDTE